MPRKHVSRCVKKFKAILPPRVVCIQCLGKGYNVDAESLHHVYFDASGCNSKKNAQACRIKKYCSWSQCQNTTQFNYVRRKLAKHCGNFRKMAIRSLICSDRFPPVWSTKSHLASSPGLCYGHQGLQSASLHHEWGPEQIFLKGIMPNLILFTVWPTILVVQDLSMT